jgi:hypothetical protein
MSTPLNHRCQTVLANGQRMTLTASSRPRAGRAEVKCLVPHAPEVGERMQQVVRLARLTEPFDACPEQVVISTDLAPAQGERDWELAAVLADRLARGRWRSHGLPVANGWSQQWERGALDGHDLPGTPPGVLLGGQLGHLGALDGSAAPYLRVSSARVWFPLHGGGAHDALSWVEVSVAPLDLAAGATRDDEEASITVVQLDPARQLHVRSVLAGARHFDGRALGRWRSAVRFEHGRFQGRSYELALVLADRLARGRELVPQGRLIASGTSSAWHTGKVDDVDGLEGKCRLLLSSARPGDRVLLPHAWAGRLAPDFAPALQAHGATLACIERIGMP